MPSPVEGSLKGGLRTEMDFLVERPSREVLDRAEFYVWRRGFSVSLGDRTETTSLFTRMQVPRKTFLKTLLNTFNSSAPTPVQKIRLWPPKQERGARV
jgi:hypothetical protein